MTIRELADHYLKLSVFSPATEKHLRLLVRLFAERAGIEQVEDITLIALQRYKMRTLEVSKPVTYNGYVKYLRRLGDFAVEMKLMPDNMFRHLRMAPVGRLPRKALQEGEAQSLVRYIDTHSDLFEPSWFWTTAIWTLYYSGMRRRQLSMLRREDVDLEQETIRLRYESSKTKREWLIPMHPDLKDTLQRYIRKVESTHRRMRLSDPLFSIARLNPLYSHHRIHDPIKPEQVTRFFQRCTKLSGISVSAHKFRHTLATTLCNPEAGSPDLFAVQEILGHVNLNTTRGYVETPLSRMEWTIKQMPRKPIGSS